MDFIYFTLAAVVLYFAADRILDRIERAAGRRFEYRSLIFFALLLVMTLTSFAVIRHLSDRTQNPPTLSE
jgi:predicted PurR-regulated permease PerM